MKFSLSVLLVIFLTADFTVCQNSNISSTDWEFQQTLKSLVDRENRIKGLIATLQPKIAATVVSFKTNNALFLVVGALQAVFDNIASLATVASYDTSTSMVTCDDIALRASSVYYDVQRCVLVQIGAKFNSTGLFIQYGLLNAAHTANYLFMNDQQKSDSQDILTRVQLLCNEYDQYGTTLDFAIKTYARLYIQLAWCKKTYCSCPADLAPNGVAIVTGVDAAVQKLQTFLDSMENNIKVASKSVIDQIAAINPSLRTNFWLSSALTSTLDTVSTLCSGYLQLTTAINPINLTTTCDGAAYRVAFIKYKMELYYRQKLESEKNGSFVAHQLLSTILLINGNSKQLTPAQKTAVDNIAFATFNVLEMYRQYIIGLCVSILQMFQPLSDAKLARSSSCNCSAVVVTTTTEAPTTITTTIATTIAAVPTAPTEPTTTAIPSTTTTGPTTTTVKPACPAAPGANEKDLTDPSGAYLKTVCLINFLKQTHPAAYTFCVSIGMKLLVIDSAPLQTALLNFLDTTLGVGNPAVYITPQIDGQRDVATGEWFYYSYGTKTPAFAGLDWMVGPNMTVGWDCLTTDNINGKFKVNGIPCIPVPTRRVLCEYFK